MNKNTDIREFNAIGSTLYTKCLGGLKKYSQYFTTAALVVVATISISIVSPTDAYAQNTNHAVTQAQLRAEIARANQRVQQANTVTRAAELVSEVRGHNSLETRIVALATASAGAFADPKNAVGTAAVVGLGTALLLPATNAAANVPPGTTQRNSTNRQSTRNNNQEVNAMTVLYQAYRKNADTLYNMSINLHFKGNHHARDDAIRLFGENWFLGTQSGLTLSRFPEDAAQFQTLRNLNPNALHMGFNQALSASQQTNQSVTFNIPSR